MFNERVVCAIMVTICRSIMDFFVAVFVYSWVAFAVSIVAIVISFGNSD